MESKDEFQQTELENLFANALERLEAGDELDNVLASCPADYREELNSLLAVVERTQLVAQESIPFPVPSHRVAARKEFLDTATRHRTRVTDLSEALDRLEAGTSLEAILTSYPAGQRAELKRLLDTVVATHHVAQEPVPLPSPSRRLAARAEFFDHAAKHRALMSLLAEALERQANGEGLEQILSSYPTDIQNELKRLLSITDSTRLVVAEPTPVPPIPRRASARDRFLARAADFRAEMSPVEASVDNSAVATPQQSQTIDTTDKPITPVRSSGREFGRAIRESLPEPSSWSLFIESIRNALFHPTGRLARVAMTILLLMLFSTASAFTVAWASIPGDLAYPLKEWSRRVGLELVPDAERRSVMRAQDEARAEEVRLAQERSNRLAQERSDRNEAVIVATMTGMFHGYRNSELLVVGSTVVLPRYQPDANEDGVFTQMTIEGLLTEGAEVELTYRIMPGQAGFVQGESLRVLVAPTATPEPLVVATSTATFTSTPRCTASIPSGWKGYRVQQGDNLSAIAARFGVSTARLAQVNCIAVPNQIRTGSVFFVPAGSLETATFAPTNVMPTSTAVVVIETPTLTATITEAPIETWTDIPTLTPTLIPTSTVEITPEVPLTITVIVTPPTVTPTSVTPSDPTSTFTPAPTVSSTVTITVTIIPSRPDSGDEVETATPTETATETPTLEPSLTETIEATQTPDVTVTVIEITPEVTPEAITPAPSETDDEPLPTTEATSEITPDVPTPTSEPEQEPTATPTSDEQGEDEDDDEEDDLPTPTETPTPTSEPEQEPTAPPTPDEQGEDEDDDEEDDLPTEEPTDTPTISSSDATATPTSELATPTQEATLPTETPSPTNTTNSTKPPTTDDIESPSATPVPTNTKESVENDPTPTDAPPTSTSVSTVPPTEIPPTNTPVQEVPTATPIPTDPPTPVPPTNTPIPTDPPTHTPEPPSPTEGPNA
ncbi:LysM peptidoglycan-binding domain-containing protein [Chloroflexi bacterium TSY]|nr:LysM peptidoglycan-binding domain-containing protein [Chloroflexi bacterium TSY]